MSEQVRENRPVTPKQRMVLDYMRGNGGELTTHGWLHLIRRGSFSGSRSLSQVLGLLADKGLVKLRTPPEDAPQAVLTAEGRRA